MAGLVEEQVSRLVESISLEARWKDYILARLDAVDERRRVAEEKRLLEERLKRLGRAFVDGLVAVKDLREPAA